MGADPNISRVPSKEELRQFGLLLSWTQKQAEPVLHNEFGGGGGSRTPVRKSPELKDYMRIQFVSFRRRQLRTDKSRRQLARKSHRPLTDRKETASLHE